MVEDMNLAVLEAKPSLACQPQARLSCVGWPQKAAQLSELLTMLLLGAAAAGGEGGGKSMLEAVAGGLGAGAAGLPPPLEE